MPDVQFNLTAQENVSQAVQRIGQSLAGLDASNAKAFGQMVQSLANAQTASTRAATSLVQLSTAETANATAAQRLAQATAQTAQAQTQAATAAQRLAQTEAQVAAAQARAQVATEGIARAHAQTEAAQSRAAQAALRLQQAEQQAASGMEQMGRAAQQHGAGVSSFFSNALSAATGFLGAQVFSRIGSDIAGLGRDIVQTAGDMERTRAGFTSILGSAQAADTLIRQLQTEAARSPFQLEDFRKASQLLLGMGVAAQDVVPRLHEVSNVVAAVGGNSQSFDRISLALGQIQAKGKVQAQEINQLAESGVAGWDILARAMNKSRAEVIALGQEGKISAETFFQAFAQFANSDAISKAADKQSHTFQGLLSTIGDVGQALMTAFGTPVLQAVEPVLERIVTSLSDPQVVTTLGQWGAAAGQFAVGLINAGQTAFTVAQQIIQALQPVTDFLGQLFGIQGQAAPTITPPDFTPAAQSAAQFGGAIKSSADSAKTATQQVADLERQTRELSRATAEANLGYDHRKQSLQDQLTLLDRQYQAENKAADISQLQQKIAKDRALAVDQYSSQGQAAAARLVDEEARLKQLQREQGHDAAKNAIEDRIKAVDREKQAYDEANSARTRALQEQMDALRANAAATTALTNAIAPPRAGTAGPDRSRNRNVNDALGDQQTAAKAQGLIGLLAQVRDALTGSNGLQAAVAAASDTWNLFTGALVKAPDQISPIGTALDNLIDTLGGRGGLQGIAIAVRLEMERLFLSLIATAPRILTQVGSGFTLLADSITVATTSANELLTLAKLQTGNATQAQFDQAHQAAVQAQVKIMVDKALADKAGQASQGTYESRIKAINADIDRQLNTELGAAAARTQAARDRQAGGVTQASSEYASTYGPQVTTTSRAPQVAPAQPQAIRMEFDEHGFKRFIDVNTGRVLSDSLR